MRAAAGARRDPRRAGATLLRSVHGWHTAARGVLVFVGALRCADGASRISIRISGHGAARRSINTWSKQHSPTSACPRSSSDELARREITEPFAVQGMVIPDGLAGHDLLVQSPTGSGKTLAFGDPADRTPARQQRAALGAGARADARARDPDRRGPASAGACASALDRGGLRRRGNRQAGADRRAGAHPRRDAGTPARPDRPPGRLAGARPAAGPRRGRPDARHGLPAGRRPDREDDARATARRCCSRRRSAARSVASRPSTPATRAVTSTRRRRRARAQRRAPLRVGRARPQDRASGGRAEGARARPDAGLRAHQARRGPAREKAGGEQRAGGCDARRQVPGSARAGAGALRVRPGRHARGDRRRGARHRRGGHHARDQLRHAGARARTTCTASGARRARARAAPA